MLVVLELHLIVLGTFGTKCLCHGCALIAIMRLDFESLSFRCWNLWVWSVFLRVYVELKVAKLHRLVVLSIYLVKIIHFSGCFLLPKVSSFPIFDLLLISFNFTSKFIDLYPWKSSISWRFWEQMLWVETGVLLIKEWLWSYIVFFALWLEVGIFDKHSN